jgi:hypothetical protein
VVSVEGCSDLVLDCLAILLYYTTINSF